MAKFVFKMQSYLSVKEKIEDQKKLEYGKAIQKLEEEKQKKRQLEQMESEVFSSLRHEIAKGISPQEFIRYKQYLTHLEREILNQVGVIKRAENYAESKRIELLAAVKQKKMVEKLKEKAFEAYLEEEARAEQRVVDEIVSYKYNSDD